MRKLINLLEAYDREGIFSDIISATDDLLIAFDGWAEQAMDYDFRVRYHEGGRDIEDSVFGELYDAIGRTYESKGVEEAIATFLQWEPILNSTIVKLQAWTERAPSDELFKTREMVDDVKNYIDRINSTMGMSGQSTKLQ